MHWNQDLAYGVGLITTDGSLSKDGRHIDLTSKDCGQLTNFCKALKLNHNIKPKSDGYSYRRYYRIQFSNIKLYKFLLEIGLTPNKTKLLGALKIPNQYFRDFLRGHLDGDGTILTYFDHYNLYKNRNYTNLRIYLKFISVSESHLRWLHERIQNLAQVKGSLSKISKKNPKHMPMWTIKFSKKESIKLLKCIYYKPNLPCLQRKKLLAEKVLELISQEKRKKYEKVQLV